MIGRSRVSRNGRLAVAIAALAVFGFGPPLRALAQDAPSQDPPSRVGYISLVEGTVSMHPSASDPWAPATMNYPMAAGTSLWTEPGAKAEIQIGAARVDLDGGTEVDIVSVDDQNLDINVPQGRADVHLHGRQQSENYEVTVPRGTVALNTDGTYRIIAGDDQAPTQIGALYGTAQLLEPSGAVPVETNNELVVTSGDPLQYTQQAVQDDGFDHWVADRSHRFERPVAHQHVSPQMVGADNLDQYGTWQTSPQYGAVWEPSAVAADWAPYRDGHWRWVAPWGWTWVDDEPWGFAPFHYGRWAQVDDRWAWVPGTVVEQPVYAPALVAFVGGSPEPEFGVGISVGIGIGAAIGWVPLGPGELYEPPYRVSDRYIRNVNITNVSQTTINNISVNKTVNVTNVNYVNQRAVTVVNRDAFVNAQPVRHAALPQAQAAKFTHPIVASAAPGHAAAAPLPQPTVASRVGAAAAAHPVQAPPQPKVQMPMTRVTAQGRVVPTAVPAAPAHGGPTAAAVGSRTGPGSVAPPPAGPGAVAQPHPPGTQAAAGTPRPGTQPTGVPQPHPLAPTSANAGSRTGAVPQPHPLGAAPASGVPQPGAQRPGVPQPHPVNPLNAAARPNPAPAPHATVPTPPPVANSVVNSAARPAPTAQPHPSAPSNTTARYPVPQPNAGAAQAVPHPAAPANTPTRYPAPRPSPAPQAQMPAAAPRPSVQPRPQSAPQPAPRAQYQSPPRPQPQAAPRAQAAPQPAHAQPQPRPATPPPNKKDDHKT
ncbi:MAG: FecR protein [Rhodospirillales bacterium]|nr:FecR protein [Rhodospirillales bacterium]